MKHLDILLTEFTKQQEITAHHWNEHCKVRSVLYEIEHNFTYPPFYSFLDPRSWGKEKKKKSIRDQGIEHHKSLEKPVTL